MIGILFKPRRLFIIIAMLLCGVELGFVVVRFTQGNLTALNILHNIFDELGDTCDGPCFVDAVVHPTIAVEGTVVRCNDLVDNSDRTQTDGINRLIGIWALYGGCVDESVVLLSNLQLTEHHPLTNYWLGWALLKNEELEPAIVIWRKGHLSSHFADIGFARCGGVGGEQLVGAETIWSIASDTAVSNDEKIYALNKQADCAFLHKEWDTAQNIYGSILGLAPQNVPANYRLAWILHFIKEDNEKAIFYAESASQSHVSQRHTTFPSETDTDLLLADINGELNKPETAWFYLEKAGRNNNDRWQIPYYFARQYKRELDFSEASIRYQEAINLNPYQPAVYRELGLLYAQTGQFEKAIIIYSQLTDIQENANSWRLLANAYVQNNDCDNAQLAFAEANRLAGDPSASALNELVDKLCR